MSTILIVDDRPTNREFLVSLLRSTGHRLLEAADGADALAVTDAQRPDLVIADILMPTMDGYEFVRRLRTDPAIADTRVIFYTAHYHELEARRLADSCRVSAVLTKPCEPEIVLQTVEAVLGHTPLPVPPLRDTREFDREHLRIMTDKLSLQADELRRSNERLKTMVELGLRLGSERDPDRLLQIFCDAVREIIGARYAVVGVASGRVYHHLLTSGLNAAMVTRLGEPAEFSGALRSAIAAGRCFRVANPAGLEGTGISPSFPPAQALLAAPLLSPVCVHGWVCLLDKPGADAFNEEDERLTQMLAAQVGRIYENDSLYADLLVHSSKLSEEVTERERTEAELREARQRLEHVVASSPAVLGSMTVQGNRILGINWISDNVEELFGYSPGDACRPDWWLTNIHPEDRDAFAQTHTDLFKFGRAGQEYRFRHRNGKYRWIRGEIRFVQNSADKPTEAVGSWWDVTERKQLEDQFRQAQKMEAVGRLAGGIAHDFNNLLTVINGYGDLVLSQLPDNDPTRELLRQMISAGERAAGLTRQLLAFSRKAIIEPKVLDLTAVVTDVEQMIRPIVGEDIQLSVNADPETGAVRADPGQIAQVILNLVVNARDAMPFGGRLTIEVRNVELDETYTRDHAEATPGPHVLLAVSDTGCGMDSATIARLFEPFFTTKGERGTGLGLATVHGIVKQSGGHVGVYSELGRGTTFKVYIPRVTEQQAGGKSRAGIVSLPQGREVVLLVEDDDAVRALSRHILMKCNYTVLEARDGIEAIRIASAYPRKIDLLVTDVVLPRGDGRQVAERLTALHRGVRVLYVSGYPADAIVRHGILESQVPFLQKPFTPSALAQKARAVLDGQK